ncbi:MAG: ParB/RepB/Spo0J family partition protein [Chitinophagales bacterium]|nr:ParB/RepB/Spo0J family partition protein [Chitinophagales bacterium]
MNDNIKPSENRTLFNINVSDISPNPFNPRLIFDPEDLNELKKSISKVGILVPVTVYRNTKNHPKTPYILLDGERRWRCAQELNLDIIPANIIDEPSDDTQNILYMFNIHHFRKEWALFPTALKLETVIDKIGTDQESILSDFTGVSRSMIRRCKTLLWYPKKYRDILMEKGGKISTDFFIELYPIVHKLSSLPEFSFPEGTERLVDKMIDKFLEQKTFYDVKEFREIRKSMGYFEKSGQLTDFSSKVSEFIENNNKGLEVFVTPEIEDDRTRNNVIKYVSYLNTTLKDINSDLISDYSYVIQLQLLQKTISELLEDID